MHANARLALLLLGVLAGGVAGYVTVPPPTVIVRVGDQMGGQAAGRLAPTPALPMPVRTSSRPADGLMAQPGGRVLIFAACGGIIGLLAGFAAGRR